MSPSTHKIYPAIQIMTVMYVTPLQRLVNIKGLLPKAEVRYPFLET